MYRMVDCATWDDPWFEALHPKGKLFFLYLLTNPRSTSCGAFEITPRKMAFETGLTLEDVEGFLNAWAPKVQWFPEHNIVFLKNFYRRQTNSEKVRINATRIVASYPIEVRRAIAIEYPELVEVPDTLSIPHAYPIDKQDVTETETKQDRDKTETPPDPPRGPDARQRPPRVARPDSLRVIPLEDTPKSEPYAAWLAFGEATGLDITAASPQEKGKSLKAAQRLLQANFTVDDIRGCAAYLASQSWRTSVLSMANVEGEMGKWAMAGKPAVEKARASPKSAMSGVDELEVLAAKYRQSAEPEDVIETTWRTR